MKQRSSEFKVHPNLSIRSNEIMSRLKNGSLKLNNGGGQFSLDEEVGRASKMSRLELIDAARQNQMAINKSVAELDRRASSLKNKKSNI